MTKLLLVVSPRGVPETHLSGWMDTPSALHFWSNSDRVISCSAVLPERTVRSSAKALALWWLGETVGHIIHVNRQLS